MTFRMPGQGGFGGGGNMTSEERLYELEAGTTKEIQMVFYDQPRMMTVNTLVSGNIPSTFNNFLRSAEKSAETNLEEYERLTTSPVSFNLEDDIIVDNEDDGFSYVSVSNESKVKQYIDSRKDKSEKINYQAINQYWSEANWTPIAHSGMYGTTIRSAFVSRNGDGGNTATWKAIMPEAGFYDIMVYIPVSAMYKRSSRGGRRGEGRGPGRGDRRRGPEFADNGTEYHYVISSNEGVEEVKFELRDPEDGWNKLGSFHFPADTAIIVLSNNTNGHRVIADAVKWVRRE
jgi:hypothetical protein